MHVLTNIFSLITFEKKVPSRSDSLFRKIDSRKFKIYIYLCLCHMVQINLFFLYDQSTIRLGENKKINLSISLIFPQYTQVFNFM